MSRTHQYKAGRKAKYHRLESGSCRMINAACDLWTLRTIGSLPAEASMRRSIEADFATRHHK